MKINSIEKLNNLNYKSSFEYRERRGKYASEKCDEELSKSAIHNSSEGLALLGLLLLSLDKITTTSLNKLKLLLMFKRSNLAYKYMKEYDQTHQNDSI